MSGLSEHLSDCHSGNTCCRCDLIFGQQFSVDMFPNKGSQGLAVRPLLIFGSAPLLGRYFNLRECLLFLGAGGFSHEFDSPQPWCRPGGQVPGAWMTTRELRQCNGFRGRHHKNRSQQTGTCYSRSPNQQHVHVLGAQGQMPNDCGGIG